VATNPPLPRGNIAAVLPQPRTDQIRLRVSPAEKAKIGEHAKAAGLGFSDYLRRRALGEVEVGVVESPVARVPAPPTSTATPSPAVSPGPVEPASSPPTADADLEAKIAARARQLHRRMSKSAALAQARRELS
jgi:hypothetical protein